MAWQLIYTSAPRLLEAGRTGFGTVARHRAVSGLLASTIERFSQFARLPGHDSSRVIYTHRILTVGSGQFHVLSCVRDAGSDYTGRTSHIAHHIIAETREIRALAATGITPADVLLATPWRSIWSDAPRYLEPAEEIDLPSTPVHEAHVWEQLTGRSDFSRLPMIPEAKKGCYLIIPPSVDARLLFRESLSELTEPVWQTTFTTCFEPNDDPSDFRWIGLPPSSPLRSNVENSSRVVFDLQRPETLPAPPPRPQPVAAQIEETIQPEFAPVESTISAVPNRSSSEPQTIGAQTMESFDDWSPRKTRGRKRAKSWRPMVMGAVALVVLGSGSLIFAHLQKERERKEAVLAIRNRIENMWNQYDLKLDDSKAWLEAKIGVLTEPEMRGLLNEHDGCLKQIKESLATGQSQHSPRMPSQSDDNFANLVDSYQKWRTKRSAAETISAEGLRNPSALRLHLSRLEEEQKEWEKFSSYYRHPPQVQPGPRAHLVKAVKDALVGGQRPEGNPGDWKQILGQLRQPIPSWLDDWERLESGRDDLSVEEAQQIGIRLKTNSQPTPPRWLLDLATVAEQDLRMEMAKATIPPPAPPTKTIIEKPAPEDPDSPTSKHPIYIYQGPADKIMSKDEGLNVYIYTADGLAKFADLPTDDRMQILMGPPKATALELSKWDKLPAYYSPNYRSKEKAELTNGRLVKLQTESEGCRMVARSQDGETVLFEVLILPSNVEPILVLGSPLEVKATGTTLLGLDDFVGRLTLPNIATATWRLTRESAGIQRQGQYDLVLSGRDFVATPHETSPTVVAPQQKVNLEKRIADTQLSIRREEDKKRELSNSREAEREEKIKACDDRINQRNAELANLQSQLTSLIPPQETKQIDLSGQWRLQVRDSASPSSGFTTLCMLEVVSSKDKSPQ